MILPNGHITSYRVRSGVKGDGSPALDAEAVTEGRPIPAQIGDPSTGRAMNARAEGRTLDLVARVMTGEMTRRGITAPKPGDRLTLRLSGALGAGFNGVVSRVTRNGEGGASGTPRTEEMEITRA